MGGVIPRSYFESAEPPGSELLGRQDGWNISLRFAGEQPRAGQTPEVSRLSLSARLLTCTFTRVAGRERERPVTKPSIEQLQIMGRSPG